MILKTLKYGSSKTADQKAVESIDDTELLNQLKSFR